MDVFWCIFRWGGKSGEEETNNRRVNMTFFIVLRDNSHFMVRLHFEKGPDLNFFVGGQFKKHKIQLIKYTLLVAKQEEFQRILYCKC